MVAVNMGTCACCGPVASVHCPAIDTCAFPQSMRITVRSFNNATDLTGNCTYLPGFYDGCSAFGSHTVISEYQPGSEVGNDSGWPISIWVSPGPPYLPPMTNIFGYIKCGMYAEYPGTCRDGAFLNPCSYVGVYFQGAFTCASFLSGVFPRYCTQSTMELRCDPDDAGQFYAKIVLDEITMRLVIECEAA